MSLKPLPNDPDKLRELLKSLKDKEMRLEADLAIKENPDYEDKIIQIILAMSDVRKAEKGLKLATQSDKEIKEEIKTREAQYKYFKNRAETAKCRLDELREGIDSDEMKSQKEQAVERLRDCYKENKPDELDLKKLVPSLEDYLDND